MNINILNNKIIIIEYFKLVTNKQVNVPVGCWSVIISNISYYRYIAIHQRWLDFFDNIKNLIIGRYF